tara:strand:+ start:369 stop:632 length:264 start_codon:yes stop_codon:yes gene_type:complete
MKNKKEEILKKIQPIFCKVFSNEKLKIDYDTSPDTIKQWDSLAQINLVIGIEKLINIKFNVSELANPKNVGEMIDIIIAKKNGESVS